MKSANHVRDEEALSATFVPCSTPQLLEPQTEGNKKPVTLQSRILWFVVITNTLSIVFWKPVIVLDELRANIPAKRILICRESQFNRLADSYEKDTYFFARVGLYPISP